MDFFAIHFLAYTDDPAVCARDSLVLYIRPRLIACVALSLEELEQNVYVYVFICLVDPSRLSADYPMWAHGPAQGSRLRFRPVMEALVKKTR